MKISVVTHTRDRAGQRLRNYLTSLTWQDQDILSEVLIVSEGSSKKTNQQIEKDIESIGYDKVRVLHCGDPKDEWNKSLGLNVGIRASRPDSEVVMILDVDMILHAEHMRLAAEAFTEKLDILYMCANFALADVPDQMNCMTDYERVRETGTQLPTGRKAPRHKLGPASRGIGGCQGAPRAWYHEVRGFDERFNLWGAKDGDIVRRSRQCRMPSTWAPVGFEMLHQHHPRRWETDDKERAGFIERKRKQNIRVSVKSCMQRRLVRNPVTWGGEP
jgi:hypothetical protein